MWDSTVIMMIVRGIGETLYMTLTSTLMGYVLGLPMGILLVICAKDGICPNAFVYKIFDLVSNIFRSIPFLILLILVMPLTAKLVGKSYGSTATIVPLTFAAAPYIARMVESSLKEARTSLIVNATIATGTILGYSAMAGTVGGGGLGDIAIRYGYYRYQVDIMIVTVIILVLLVQLFQSIGMLISRKMDKRRID